MSFGTDKSKSKSTTSHPSPPNFTSPYGSLLYGKKQGYVYQPNESAAASGTRDTEEKSIQQLAQNLPTNFDINSYYNNPFYDTTAQLYQQPIQQRQAADQKDLANRLAAQNQIGSSYDAYSRYLQGQQYDQAYSQAQNQARLGSADAYSQAINQNLATLSGLRGDLNQNLNAYYAPLQYALQSQSAFAPYQSTTTTGSQSTTPSFLTRYTDFVNAGANAAKAAAAFV